MKLRKEITALRERFSNRQKDWAEVRECYEKLEIISTYFIIYYQEVSFAFGNDLLVNLGKEFTTLCDL